MTKWRWEMEAEGSRFRLHRTRLVSLALHGRLIGSQMETSEQSVWR